MVTTATPIAVLAGAGGGRPTWSAVASPKAENSSRVPPPLPFVSLRFGLPGYAMIWAERRSARVAADDVGPQPMPAGSLRA
jgi:hypothetical protein